jgi:hypothetical protein
VVERGGLENRCGPQGPPRVRIPPPPPPWLGRAKFAADTRSSTLGGTSPDRGSGVNERQRTPTTASATGISFPPPSPFSRLPPVARASTAPVVALLRCKFLPGTQEPAGRFRFDCAMRHSVPQSAACPTVAALTPAMATVPDLVRHDSHVRRSETSASMGTEHSGSVTLRARPRYALSRRAEANMQPLPRLAAPDYRWIVSPASSIATNFAKRRARVSGFLASWSR